MLTGEDPTEVENWVRQRVLGSGGFGVVTLWKHKTGDQMIALKKCRWGTDQLLTPKHKERWSKEVEIMQRLSHPNVVRAVAVPGDLAAALKSDLPMLCMEFCSKGDLRQVLNRAENCCGLREGDVRALVSDLASAVKYLHHMKVTHRDLKPENIVLQQAEQRVTYKLIDLGYAKELDQSSICTSFVGTLQYLAPELFMSQNYTCSVDYWSLGLVAHEVMTGVRPFLPNMPPVSWMSHVSGKSSDDISAYQARDGSIVFSKQLFPQNHISSCLKYYMERWLKVCLEWDSRKRGRDFTSDKDGEIVVFCLIEDVLGKMMLSVYDSINYQLLSYEVDKSTAAATLQRWIERDTGLLVEHQELLLADGTGVDLDKEAWLCLTQQDAPTEAQVLVYRKQGMSVPQVTPLIPASVSAMMQDPRQLVAYAYQVRAYAHAVFFLDQERQLSRAFRHAAGVKLLKLTNSSRQLSRDVASVSGQLSQVEAQHEMNEAALQFDQQQAQQTATIPAGVTQRWEKNSAAIRLQLDKLRDVVKYLKTRSDSAVRKSNDLGSSACLGSTNHDNLNALVEAGTKCYEGLRRRPKDKRHEKSDSVEMVKVVYNCLKTRDKLLRDANFATYIQQVVSIQVDVDKLQVPLSACVDTVGRVRVDLSRTAADRQADVWSHLTQVARQNSGPSAPAASQATPDRSPSPALPAPQETAPQSLAPQVLVPQSSAPLSSAPQSLAPQTLAPQSLAPQSLAPQSLAPQSLAPQTMAPVPVSRTTDEQGNVTPLRHVDNTDAMINDNIALRYATQDLMNESFLHYRSILHDEMSLDWTYMQ